ncbi:MAG: type VI secretion system-associated protein TagF [Spongiibacteraceae bacterium]
MDQPTLGLYGKVPAHGDFIDRQLPVEFIRQWDDWLQRSMAGSQERLADNWLSHYLTSPIWRFVLTPGALDHQSWAGILVPSVDSVGRYFPLTIASPIAAQTAPSVFYQHNIEWFQALEHIALDALQNGINAEQISDKLLLTPTINNPKNNTANSTTLVQSDDLESALAAQLDKQLAQLFESSSLWSSVYIEPPLQQLLINQGMPSSNQFTTMIDSQWQHIEQH